MKRSPGALLALLLALLPAPAWTQEVEGYVLPPGVVRLSGGGEFAGFDEVYGQDGGEDVGASLEHPLVAASFVPLRPLEASLTSFFAGTPGDPFTLQPNTLSLGTPDLSIFLNRTRAPLRLELGIAPRVQLGVSIPFVLGEMLVQRYAISDASVGANPSPAANGALLGQIGASWAALGRSALLPTAESAAGQELQRRVQAATGQSLQLPASDSVDFRTLQPLLLSEFGVDSIAGSMGDWWPGDVEVEARVSVIDQVGGVPLPLEGAGTAYRLAVSGAVRFPTGARSDSARLFPRDPELGFAGGQLALAGDAFIGQRWWIGFAARNVFLTTARVVRRVAPLDAPLSTDEAPELVDWNPPDTLEVMLSPRFRLARIIAMGLDYRAGLVAESSYQGEAALLDTPGGFAHSLGVTFRFNSVPTFIAREAALPIEVVAGYTRSLGGPEGAGAYSSAYLRGSVLTKVWGRGLRR